MATFDLGTYLSRIGWDGPRRPTLEALSGLLRAHMVRIPFENLNVLLGRGVRLDLDSVYDKLVLARRGGYCFEHATLFEAAIRQLGFDPVAHSARVVMLTPRASAPQTHMFLTVQIEGATFVLDPGFGGNAPVVPVPLVDGAEARDGAEVHRLVRQEGEWVLETQIDGAMKPLWSSSLAPQYPIDFVVANHYVSTLPDSPFVTRVMLRALTPDGRVSVMNRDVTTVRAGQAHKTSLADRAALRGVLAAHFGFDLPEAEVLRVPSLPEWV